MTQLGLKTIKLNMKDDLHHVQQALEGLEEQLSCLAKGVKDLRREEEAILEQTWEQNVESLFYSYGVKEEEKFYSVLKSFSYEVNVWWYCKGENRRRMGAQPIKTWSLMKQSLRSRFGVGNQASKVKELPNATIEAKEVIEIHVEKETSKEEPCCIISGKNIEIKEKERVEEKERLVERSCNFNSISIISKESEHFECSKEKESEIEKSERVKENECFIKKQESEKKSKEKKEIVVLEKSDEVNFYANETNSSFASECLCVHNFEDSRKNGGGKLAYKSIKTINFFPSNSYLSFEIYFKEIKLFSLKLLDGVDDERSKEGKKQSLPSTVGSTLPSVSFIEIFSSNPLVKREDSWEEMDSKSSLVGFTSCGIRSNLSLSLLIELLDNSVGLEAVKVFNALTMHGWKNNRGENHDSYIFYAETRLGARIGYVDRSFERVPKKETRKEENYENIDERFHSRRGNVKITRLSCVSFPFYRSGLDYIRAYKRRKRAGFNTWSGLKGSLSDKFGVGMKG
ncbi:hypothetical protein M9H77_23461 [Catharanthus roseus]|uniref:Uncharacterized protein n=1 Tax=Catharanthus roseus TaxID=4058 RepID=A0ACC0AT32_CATRO|nr:hypothetical protein M9H77_23461 [Catharanthus roseus]